LKIVFELPEYDYDWVLAKLSENPDDPHHLVARSCHVCGGVTGGVMLRFVRLWWHVRCLEETFSARAVENRLLSAWLLVALDVAKYPSKHSAAEIRSVIHNLVAGPMMTALWRAGKDEAARDI
jgi:hypothetical protein